MGGITRHQQLNDLLWRSLGRSKILAVKEPEGLARADGKCPDGLTFIPWSKGRCLVCDVTVADTVIVRIVLGLPSVIFPIDNQFWKLLYLFMTSEWLSLCG